MTETLASFFIDLFGTKIPAELTAFVVSLMPILELRGGLCAASALEIDWLPAFVICYIGNMLPIPFILLFIRKIFAFLKYY